MNSTTNATAIELRHNGLAVIPIKTDGSKRPALESWKTFQTKLPTIKQTEQWFRNGAGVGVVCGPVSGNLEIIDVDDEATFEPFRAEVERLRPGLLAELTIVKTPRPGFHIFYRCEAVEGNQKLASIPAADEHGKATTKALIETRGTGGYALTVGSPAAAHPTGRTYEHYSGPPVGEAPTIEPDERDVLLSAARSFNRVVDESRIDRHADANQNHADSRPGDAYEATSWTDILVPHGWEIERQAGDVTHWRRPGKDTGTSATTGLRSKAGNELLYIFSSNAAPFEPGSSYTKFGAFALLNHRGDFSAAARDLSGSPARAQLVTAGAEDAPLPESNPWPAPMADEAYHGLVGKIVRTIDLHSEADPAALLVQTLVAIGCLIDRTAYFGAESDLHFGNLFVVLVGRTSKGRKGTSWGHIERLLRMADETFVNERVQGGLSSGEGLIWAVRDPIMKLEAIKEKGRTVGTHLVLADPGVSDKRLLAMESEFASVLAVAARERNTVSAILRQAWDGKKLQTMTKNSPATATNAHISIVGHITAEELRKQFAAVDMANGVANRFLWVCVQRSKELPLGSYLPDKDLARFAAPLQLAIEFATKRERALEDDLSDVSPQPPEPWRITRDEAANQLWCEVYGALSEGKPGLLGAALGRAEPLVMRLAMLYAVIDREDHICEVHLRAALAVWRYCEDSARYIFGDAMGDPLADSILAELRRRKPNGMSRSEIRDYLNRHGKAAEIAAALISLREQRLVRSETDHETGGRPRELWYAV